MRRPALDRSGKIQIGIEMSNSAWKQKRYYERKKHLYLLLGNRCAHCKKSFDDYEFDHIDPSTKSIVLTRLLIGNWGDVLEEARKCQILCHDCHLSKTLKEKGQSRIIVDGRIVKHSNVAYVYGCRCDECTKDHRDYQREYMKRQRDNKQIQSH